MTPKRFKAIQKSTGKIATRDLYYLFSEKNENGELFIKLKYHNQDIELCQSTGLTDSRGSEVFFDDVLFFRDKSFWVVQFSLNDQYSVIRRLNERFEVCEYTKERPFDLRSIKGLKPIIVGNRWMPAAETQARAEAVIKQ